MRAIRTRAFVEECWTLVGWRRGRVWYARPVRRCVGEASSVAFDGAWTLAREERQGDVVGFLHTHPPGALRASRRDVRTMRAWCAAMGKPLLCAIVSARRIAVYRFDDDTSDGVLIAMDLLARSDDDGNQQAAARGAVPRRRAAGEAAHRARGALRRRRAGLEPRR